MRIVSLLASATEIVDALGASPALVGRSHECDNPDWVRSLPECSSPAFDVSVSSGDIDREVNRRLRAREPLYIIHTQRIEDLRPDLILTQEHCEVRAVTPGDLGRSGYRLAEAQMLALAASTLDDIFDNIARIARALDRPLHDCRGSEPALPQPNRDSDGAASLGAFASRGEQLAAELRGRLEAVRQRTAGRQRPSIAVLEWVDPIFVLGNWGPELVDIAGGEPVLANRNRHSFAISPELLREADPEFLIVAPCGFDLERAWRERSLLETLPWWKDLRAVREENVAFADGNRLFNRSGISVARTAEVLAEIMHGVEANPPAELHDFRWYTKARVRVP